MRCFRDAFVGSALLILAFNVYATTQETINCPPISTVQNSIFTRAKFQNYIGWDMISDNFNYQGKKWNTLFRTASLDKVINASDAINRGQTIFNALTLHEPRKAIDRNITICTYVFTNQYLVVTATPAIDLKNAY